MNREEFMKLSAEDQWEWVVKNTDQVELIELDNDATWVKSPCFQDGDTDSVSMKSFIGDGEGAFCLISAIGIAVTGV